jgi:hypothetical protein
MELFKPGVTAASMISLVLAAVAFYQSSLSAQEPLPSVIQAKLDSRLLQRLRDLEINGQADEKLNVLVQTVSDINPDQESLLLKMGMIINSKLGSVISAVVPAGSVRDIAALEFVLRIELAKKLKKREDQR